MKGSSNVLGKKNEINGMVNSRLQWLDVSEFPKKERKKTESGYS